MVGALDVGTWPGRSIRDAAQSLRMVTSIAFACWFSTRENARAVHRARLAFADVDVKRGGWSGARGQRGQRGQQDRPADQEHRSTTDHEPCERASKRHLILRVSRRSIRCIGKTIGWVNRSQFRARSILHDDAAQRAVVAVAPATIYLRGGGHGESISARTTSSSLTELSISMRRNADDSRLLWASSWTSLACSTIACSR